LQITLNQDEIEEAIEAFVRTQITISPSQEISIDLRAGRGDNGFSATLEIKSRKAKAPVMRSLEPAPEPAPVKPTAYINTQTNEIEVEEAPAPAADISETVQEHVEESTDAPETEETPEPARKGSIFNFKG
jgi:hypothetical protein